MIKTIAFDIGNVLFISKKTNFNISKRLGIERETWHNKIRPIIIKSMKGKLTKKQTLDEISKEQGNTISKKKIERGFRKLSKKGLPPNIPLIKITKILQKKGYNVIIISNAWALDKDNLAYNRRLKHIKQKILSCNVKSYKPQSKIFKIALKKSKTKPSEMLFIDNLEKNTIVAEKLGIKTIIFGDTNQTINDINKMLGEKVK